MSIRFSSVSGGGVGDNFDLFRLSKSKDVVDVCPNTLRLYHKQGLPFYRNGKAVFVSKYELAAFIRSKSVVGV
jgi:hypothetical protein